VVSLFPNPAYLIANLSTATRPQIDPKAVSDFPKWRYAGAVTDDKAARRVVVPPDDTVPRAIGANIRRIRLLRKLKGQDLVDRLGRLGFSLPTSGLSEVEAAKRRVTAEELLIFAIALNTSVVDLLTPPSGKPLVVATKVDPIPSSWLESWLGGDKPWPPAPTNSAAADEFFGTASEFRKRKQRTEMRPEMQEISDLRDAVASAIDGPGPLNEIADPDVMAQRLREQVELVGQYVKLLADRLEKHGYASR
jgi:transcriptional regulator with XRE-family HTH domain